MDNTENCLLCGASLALALLSGGTLYRIDQPAAYAGCLVHAECYKKDAYRWAFEARKLLCAYSQISVTIVNDGYYKLTTGRALPGDLAKEPKDG